jgi:hypothetical protein
MTHRPAISIFIPVVQTMLITLEGSLLDLCKCDAGNGVVDVAVVPRKREIDSDSGAEVILPQKSIGCFELLPTLEGLLQVEGFLACGVGRRTHA